VSRPRYCTYHLQLKGDDAIIALLKKHLPANYPTIGQASAKRRAIVELFGEAAQVQLVSECRVPPRRRVLRV
jgi:hypothetical protein